MSTDFDSYLDAILDANDEKMKQQAQVQIKVRDEAAEFVESFKDVAARVIRPALEHIKTQLEGRGRPCRIEETPNVVAHDGKEQRAAVSIYFNVSPDNYVSRLSEYAHVIFYCDKHGKVVNVHESTITPNHGGQSGSAGSLKLNEITEETVKLKAMKVLKEIYK